jgi:TonB-linked SusC/RagA family outer membrane protein
MKRTCSLLLSLAGFTHATRAHAQVTTGIIRGTVQGSAGAPLARVNIVLEGTRNGSQTGTDGRYIIRAIPGSYTVRVSLIGYMPLTRPVRLAGGDTITADFQLSSLPVQLGAVVSTGYRSQERATVTGSVTSVTSEEFKDVPADNLSNALAGRLSGVAITQNAGTPGRESSIRVRAVGTFNNSSPLYVIDGVVTDKFTFDGLSTAEVESVSILKDGAAASIYGSRAANGVVLVTTNRGRLGSPQFSYSATLGSQAGTRVPRGLNAYEHATAINDALAYNAIPRTDARYYADDELDYFKTHSWSWLDAMWRTPVDAQHTLNINGGAEGIRYFLNGSVLDETGSFDNLNFRRYTSRGNLDVDVTSRLKAAVDFSGTRRDRHGPSWGGSDWAHEDLYKALNLRSAMVPPYINGLPVGNWVEWHPGVVITDKQGYDNRDWTQFNTKLRLDYQLPHVDGLRASMSYFRSLGEEHRKQFNLPYQMAVFNTLGTNNHIVGDQQVGWRDRTQAEFLLNREDRDDDYQFNGQVDYKRSFGSHNLDALLVYEQAKTNHVWFDGRRDNFISPVIDQFVGGSADEALVNGSQDQGARLSYVGSLNYAFAEKYFLQGSFRYDGSVIFAPDRRWGFFPAVSAGWRVTEEPFFKLGFINDLKLRASYGVVGNDDVGSFQWLQTYTIQPGAIFGAPTTGLSPGSLANRNITWEKSRSSNAGLDSRFWNNRMSLTVDLFRRNTYDILGSRGEAIPSTFGASLPDENYEEINSHGYEVELGYDSRFGGSANAFRYYLKGLFGYATNEIVRLNEAQNIRPYQSRIGRTTAPSSACFGLIATNIIRTTDDLAALPTGYTILGLTPKLGMLNYKDLRSAVGDDPDGKITNDDRAWICDYNSPPMNFGLTIGGSWRALRIDALFNGAAGSKHMMQDNGRDIQMRAEESSYNYWRNSWTPDNPDGAYPGWRDTGFRTRYPVSTFWLRDASFVRLKNLTVSYDLPSRLTNAFGANTARLYFTGSNLALLYDKFGDWGFDPEMIDIRAYPLMRTLTVGMDVSLKRRTP